MPWVYLYKLIVKMFTDLIYIHPLCRTGEDATLYESNWRGTLFNNTVSLLLYVVGLFVTIWLRLRKLRFKFFVLFHVFSLWLQEWIQGVLSLFVVASKQTFNAVVLSLFDLILLPIMENRFGFCNALCFTGWLMDELIVFSLVASKWSLRFCVFCRLMVSKTTFTL